MLQLGDTTLPEEELERVEWRDGRFTLRLRWRFEELPLLLDLPDDVVPELARRERSRGRDCGAGARLAGRGRSGPS